MEEALETLKQESKSKDLRSCMETLIKIFRNIKMNPNEEKYRKLRTSNQSFMSSVWQFEGGKQMMLAGDWQEEADGFLVMDMSVSVEQHIKFLIDNRDVKPSVAEWVEETKHIIPNAEKERDRVLRAEALVQKEKDMVELKKDMAERDAIAATILCEHRNDSEKRKLPVNIKVPSSSLPLSGTAFHHRNSPLRHPPLTTSSTNNITRPASRGAPVNSGFPALSQGSGNNTPEAERGEQEDHSSDHTAPPQRGGYTLSAAPRRRQHQALPPAARPVVLPNYQDDED